MTIDRPFSKTYAQLHDELTEQGHATPDAMIWDIARAEFDKLEERIRSLEAQVNTRRVPRASTGAEQS